MKRRDKYIKKNNFFKKFFVITLVLALTFGNMVSVFGEVSNQGQGEDVNKEQIGEETKDNSKESNKDIDNKSEENIDNESEDKGNNVKEEVLKNEIDNKDEPKKNITIPLKSLSITPASTVQIDTVADLKQKMESAQEGDLFSLSSAFVTDMLINGPVVATISHNNSFTIEGNSLNLIAPSGSVHFNINNQGTGEISFKNVSFKGGGAATGGVVLAGSDYSFNNCKFDSIDNSAIGFGMSGANIKINDTVFSKVKVGINMINTTISAGKKVTIVNTSFQESTSYAINGYNGILDFDSVIFEKGKSTAVYGGIDASMQNCSFNENVGAGASPGAIYPAVNSKFMLNNCNIYGNHQSAGGGGAIVLTNGLNSTSKSIMQLNKCYVWDNYTTAQLQGGAIYGGTSWSNGGLVIKDCIFENNSVKGTPNSTTDGGAIGIRNSGTGTGASVNITGTNFTNNFAGDDGGALLLEGGQTVDRLNTYIANCTFMGNICAGYNYNGSGSAIQFYGMTSSEITNCTFYGNNVTGTNLLLGGGTVALDTGTAAPATIRPILSNNIFIANTMATLGRTSYSNIYINANADAGATKNNGNVGFDNGLAGYSQGENIGAKIILKNVFKNFDSSNIPIKTFFGENIGATGSTMKRFCYIISPLTDEMYRDGSGPFYDPTVRFDVRGYPRDHFANAGAVEIYWTKFDPDIAAGGYWVAPPPDGIESLLSDEVYYLVTNPYPDNEIITFPRATIDIASSNLGFKGWEANQPRTSGGTDYPIVQPHISVNSTKQTYVAKWLDSLFRVDFDLQYDGKWGEPLLEVPLASTILAPNTNPTRAGYDFGGWYKDKECTNKWNFEGDTVSKDIVLYAKWDRKQAFYRVDFNLQYGGKFGKPIINVAAGSLISEPYPSPIRKGYTFEGWCKDKEGTKRWNFKVDTVNSNLTLYAAWTKDKVPEDRTDPGNGDDEKTKNAGKVTPISKTGDGLGGAVGAFILAIMSIIYIIITQYSNKNSDRRKM